MQNNEMEQGSTAPNSDSAEIAIRLRNIGQLFNTLDPSPFREKDIDAEVEDFIVGWVRELPHHTPFRLAVHLPPEEARKSETEDIDKALAHYFHHRADMTERQLRELFRVGRIALAIGMVTLSICLIASQLAPRFIASPALARIVEESLILVGWVANWRPIEIYLYDWWPIRRRAQLYRRIAAAPVVVRTD